jgi:hypothetical protein
MNSLIQNRTITPEDILRERQVRAKVLYSPCQDCDIKWRYCSCFVCRTVWDPTGEEDARIANAQREQELELENKEPESDDDDPFPMSLPPPKDSDKRFTLTGSEINIALRLLTEFGKHLDQSIEEMMEHREERIRATNCIPPTSPELTELFSTKSTLSNVIHDLSLKLMF